MSEVAKLLQEYGGWGVAAVCMVVVLKMWQYIVKRNEHIDQLHREQREDSKEMVTALVSTRDAVRSFKDMIQMVSAGMTRESTRTGNDSTES